MLNNISRSSSNHNKTIDKEESLEEVVNLKSDMSKLKDKIAALSTEMVKRMNIVKDMKINLEEQKEADK